MATQLLGEKWDIAEETTTRHTNGGVMDLYFSIPKHLGTVEAAKHFEKAARSWARARPHHILHLDRRLLLLVQSVE